MKRFVLTIVVVAGLVGGLVAMMGATKNRPDEVVAGSRTTVTFSVSTRDYQRGEEAAAAALWAVCSATVDGAVSAAVPVDDDWRATIEPAIGEHGQKRLVGCLDDVTLERVKGAVVSVVRS
ncbi:MAG TPA: hypothetical protein VGK49_06250 [Ilumatobacteraceae bacterium]